MIAVKGQVLVDFVAKFTPIPKMEKEMEPIEPPK